MITTDSFQITPIPIETAYFLDDAAKYPVEEKDDTGKVKRIYKLIRDPNKFNRYYFNYPPEWKTSNMGENIVGVRSLWTMNKPREFYFSLFLRKYKKVKFYEALKKYDSDKYKNITDKDKLYNISISMSDAVIQKVINLMNEKDVIVFPFNFHISLRSEDNFNDMWGIINETLANQTDLKSLIKDFYTNSDNYEIEEKLEYVQALNKYNDNDELLYQYGRDVWFSQQLSNVHNFFGMKKDVSIYETYNNGDFVEHFHSPCNVSPNDAYFVDMLFANNNNTYFKKYVNNLNGLDEKLDDKLPNFFCEGLYSPFSRNDPQPLTEDDEFSHDFNAMFNVGNERHQNSLDFITTYHRSISFRNVYNRESLKIYASFASQSNDYYVGNSHVYFNPIKYYKLNSKDDKFWIEFYSGRHYNYPVNISEDEGFIMEMLFMQNQKLLYT